MLIHYEESTTGSTNFDGTTKALGLIATGSNKTGSLTILRQFGFKTTAAVTTLEVRVYDDTGTPVLMETPVSQSSVTSYLETGMAVAILPGWTLEVHTTGASAGGTAWAVTEETSEYK